MKRWLIIPLIIIGIGLLLPYNANAVKMRAAYGLIGGATGDLDNIDGANLLDGDLAIVAVPGDSTYFYWLDDDSAAGEASPGIISPDDNAGDKRWILIIKIPIMGAAYDTEAELDALFAAKLAIDDSPLTGDPTITDTTPTFTFQESDDTGTNGTGAINFQSSGAYDVIGSIYTDVAGSLTEFMQFDGVAETVDILKPATGSSLTLTTGLILGNGNYIRGSSTDNHTYSFQGYNTGGIANWLTVTNDTGGLMEVVIDNCELTMPRLTGAVSTTGAVTGLTDGTIITKCEGLTEDGGADSNTLFTDSGESLTADAYIGMTIYNTTDVSSATVTDNDGTTITCDGLSGGTDDLFQDGDAIALGPGPRQSNGIFYINAATTILHPSTAGYTAGYYCVGSNVIKIDPQSDSMTINFSDDGVHTDPGAGDEIDGDGSAGDFIVIHNASATEAYSWGVNGSWADGGAS